MAHTRRKGAPAGAEHVTWTPEVDAVDHKAQKIVAAEPTKHEPTKPHWDMSGSLMPNHGYHHVNHTETYNKNWVEGERQMTLDALGKQVEFIRRCMGMAGVAILAILLIVLVK